MRVEDFIGPPCDCPECRQADVTDRDQIRDRDTGRWLHGYALKRWYEARDRFRAQARAAVGASGRHDNGFEKLVK